MTAFKHTLRRPASRRLALVSAVAAGGLLLAACGGNDDMNGMDHGSAPSSMSSPKESGSTPAPGAFDDADVKFAQGMIPHHEQAVEMAKLADGRASDSEIKTLAADIEKAQDPEIQTMKSWLKSWGKPESPGMDHSGMGNDSMSGMMSDKGMEELKAAKGTDFDRKFAQMMIEHHNGAISMAKDEQKNGRNAAAKKLADDVIKNQTAEVEKMQKILDRL